MDGFELLAKSYEKQLKEHPEWDATAKEEVERTIKCLNLLVGTNDLDRDEIFNSGAFNDICKGYFRKSMQNCKLDDDTINAVMDEFKWLLETISATEARKF